MMAKEYLLASDFDQTLSFNDSGIILSEIVGIPGFREKVAGLSRTNLVQQGGELAYLLRHDPDYRAVRREHLIEAGEGGPPRENKPPPPPPRSVGGGGVTASGCAVPARPP